MWIATILIAALYALHAGAKPGKANPTAASGQSFTAINETQTVMRQLADGRVFSGAVAVQKAGSIVYSEGFGYALQELGVPMKAEYIFPLGSQAKFFTSVAIHQLAKQGYLNISDPAAIHLDPADFPALRNKTWCPLVHDRESDGCQNVTVLQLLTMTSGILPADMGLCEDLPASKDWTPADWYYPYRVTALNLTYGDATGATGDFLNGAGRLVDVVNRIRVLEMPLLSAPGESWCYDDANYNILGYLVEKFSNTSIREYIQSHILTPANLTDTFYWNGAPGGQPGGLRMRTLPVPAYTADFTGTAPPYTFASSNRFRGWTGDLGFQVGASGAMFSTVTDSLKWYTTFLLRPKVLGLTKADISAMITPQLDHLPRLPNGTKGPGYTDAAQFAQGMSTHGSSDTGHGIEFTGGQWGFMVNTRVWLNDKDWSQSDAVAVFMNSTPHLPASDNCTVASPTNDSVITVATEVCGHVADESTPFTDYVVSELARIWNITGVYPQATAQLG